MNDISMHMADAPSKYLSACVLLLRAEAAKRSGCPPSPDQDQDEEQMSTRSSTHPVQFVETAGAASLANGAVVRCEISSSPRQPSSAPRCTLAVGRGPWQLGEGNGIVSFTFRIATSRLGDGARMRIGIAAQGEGGQMDYCLWFNPYTGCTSALISNLV